MRPATPLRVLLAASLAAPCAAADTPAGNTVLNVTSAGSPRADFEIAFNAASTGMVTLGRTDAQGDLTLALEAANLGKAPLKVVSEECPSRAGRLWLIGPGGQLPPAASGCDRNVVGAFAWGSPRVSVDLLAGVVEGGSRSSKLPLALTLVGAGLTIYGLVGTKNVCDGQSQDPSCEQTRTGVLVAGIVLTAGGIALWYFGKNRSAVGELAFVPGGVMIRQRVRF
jgi:hypothetical protein